MACDTSYMNEKKNDVCVTESNEYENNIDSDLMNDMINYYQFIKLSNFINENIKNIKASPYFVFILSVFFDYLNTLLDNYIKIKLYSKEKYNLIKDCLFSNNYVQEIYLLNENNYIKVEDINIELINKQYFEETFKQYKITLDEESCILIKYYYKEKNYRLYINYNEMEEKVINLPLNIENMNKEYEDKYKKDILYFFKNECSEIESAQINEIDIKEIMEECNGIFNDFGLLSNNKIHVKYLMKELNIVELESLELKYKNFHLDEDAMELLEHKIEIKDKNSYLTSEIINKIIKLN